jgi:DNA-binding transcriptional ArsR family regulator
MTENDRAGEGYSNRALTFAARKPTMTVSHPLPDDLIELVAERFRTLSEPTRIKLLDRLREGEASPLELTELIGTTQQNVSKHLGVLQRAGIVARRKQGNFSYYRIIDEGVFSLCEAVCGSLQQQAESLQQLVGAATT